MNLLDGIIDSGDSTVSSGSVLYLDAAQLRSYSGSGTIWTDLSGNNYTGSLTNTPGFSSANGGSIVFDGTNDFVDNGNILDTDGTSPFSVSAWFRTTSTANGAKNIVSKELITSPFTGWQLGLNTTSATAADIGKVGIAIVTSTTQIMRRLTSASFNNGAWYNTVFTYDGSKTRAGMLLYINGSLATVVNSDSATVTNTISNAANYNIGGRNNNTSQVFPAGNIANVKHYNRVLTATEVKNNFDAIKSRFGYGQPIVTSGSVITLDASDPNSYPGSGTLWTDISGNGFNATMTGSVAYSGSLPSSFDYKNGVNNYFLGNSDLTGSIINGVTIMSWIKVYNTSVRSTIFSKYNNTGIPGYLLEAGTAAGSWTNTLRFYAQGTVAASTDYRGAANSITQGSIFSAAATFDFATKTTAMYVNGLPISASQAGTPASIGSDWYKSTPLYRIGSYRPAVVIDAAMNQYNIRVYNRALSPTEIFVNFEAERSTFGV